MLKDRVADPAIFEQLFEDGLQARQEALTSYKAAESFCKSPRSGEFGQQVLDKLHAGFELEHELVQAILTRAIKWSADQDLVELHLKLPKSRACIILPDITGALKKDEIINLAAGGQAPLGKTVVRRTFLLVKWT